MAGGLGDFLLGLGRTCRQQGKRDAADPNQGAMQRHGRERC